MNDRHTNDLEKLKIELTLRSYSQKTLRAYSACLKSYFDHRKDQWNQFDEDAIKQFLFAMHEKELAQPCPEANKESALAGRACYTPLLL